MMFHAPVNSLDPDRPADLDLRCQLNDYHSVNIILFENHKSAMQINLFCKKMVLRT